MEILVVATNRHAVPFPVLPLGACMAADAAARAGHRVRFLDLMFEKEPRRALADALAQGRPDLVGLSVRNIDNNDLLQPRFFLEALPGLVAAVRAGCSAPVVVGGAAVPVMPEAILRHSGADALVLGDGEAVFPALIAAAGRGAIAEAPGVAWLEGDAFRHNPLPPAPREFSLSAPDFRRWLDLRAYRRGLATVPLQTKLGCRFGCVYCTYRKIEGAEYRLGDPASVVRTVQEVARAGLRDIEFVDNVFNCPAEHALSICEGLRRVRHGARLQSLELNPLFVDDRLIGAMEDAGFVGVGVTAESAADPVLAGLGKGFDAAVVHRTAEVMRRHRLPCLWIFLLGGPGETPETVEETLDFVERRLGPRDAAFFNIGLRVYPGTALEGIARREGGLTAGPERMLEPVFYLSPQIDRAWLDRRLREFTAGHLNVLDSTSLAFPLLPALNRLGSALGLRPPLWRRTPAIRRALKLAGLHP